MEYSYESYKVRYECTPTDCVLTFDDSGNLYEGRYGEREFQDYSVFGGFTFVSKIIQDALEGVKQEVSIQSCSLVDASLLLAIRVSLPILPKPIDISLRLPTRKPNTVEQDIQEIYKRLQTFSSSHQVKRQTIVDYKILAIKYSDARNFDHQCVRFEQEVMEHIRTGWSLYGKPTNICDDNQHSSTTFSQTMVKYSTKEKEKEKITGYKIIKRNNLLKHKFMIEDSIKEHLRSGWSLHGESYAVLNYGDPNDPSSRFYQFMVKYE
jgi:hypothetical protein